jgi:Sel1 repeat
MIRTFFIFLMMVFVGASAIAEDFQTTLRNAENGDSYAMHSLGVVYANGEGRPQDYAESYKWFEKAALLGQHNAMYSLGIMHEKGQGREIDLVKSAAWFMLASLYIPRLADEWFLPHAKVAMYIRRPGQIVAKLSNVQSASAERLYKELGTRIALPQSVVGSQFMVLSRAWVKPEWHDAYSHGLIQQVNPRLYSVKYAFALPVGGDISSAEAFSLWEGCMFGTISKQKGFSRWALGGTKGVMSKSFVGETTRQAFLVLLKEDEDPQTAALVKDLVWDSVQNHQRSAEECRKLLRPELMWQ